MPDPIIDGAHVSPQLRTTAFQSKQGGRTVYRFVLSMEDFDALLPDKVDASEIKDNRRFTQAHADSIADYLQATPKWVLGPVTLGTDDSAVDFRRYEGQASSQAAYVGELTVSAAGLGALKVLDGQHRRAAIGSAREELGLSPESHAGAAAFRDSTMAVDLYIEGEVDARRQMFADMAKQKPMDQVTRTRFDRRDPFNRASWEVKGASDWLDPFVEMDLSAVPRTSDKLLAFNQLAMCIKTLEVGFGGRVSKQRLSEASTEVEFERIVLRAVEWVDDFLPSAREEYEALVSGETEDGYVQNQRQRTLAYSPTALRILAGATHLWERDGRPLDQLAQFVRSQNFKTNQQRGLFYKAKVLVPDGTSLLSRRQDVRRAIDAIVEGARKENEGDDVTERVRT
ncbi:MAG: DGQHR domain-containing protein [Chloroflexi bacterium]|nr:DGQHR domain-containing protein [Chloroflexota bacterium]